MKDFYTVKQFSMKHSVFSEASLRSLIFNEKDNGLYVAIRRIGTGKRKRVLIDEAAFFDWIENQQKEVA